eukprot:gene9228-11306_t
MLGIIFVVHTSIGGDKLIFRYPTVTRNKVSDETLMAFKQQHPLTTSNPNQPGGSNKGTISSGNETENNGQQDYQTTNTNLQLKDRYFIYNLPSVVITPILTPKQRLCDQSFELTIENTKFIGHPTLLSSSTDQDDDDDDDEIKNKEQEEEEKEELLEKENEEKEKEKDEKEDEIEINDLKNSCQEDRTKESKNKINNNNKDTKTKDQYHDEITLFNIVFVLSTRSKEVADNRSLEESFKRISMQLSAALKHEQLRCNYLTNQVHEMMVLREQWLTEQTLETGSNEKPNHQTLTDRMLKASRLAREIRDLYTGLKEKQTTSLKINGWIQLHLNLSDPDDYPVYPVRPYHSLLPFTGEDSTQLPIYDSSPALLKLLKVAQPIKHFRDLQLDTDLPLAYIYRLASHLVYWKKAKIINMMTKNNYYVLTPDATSYRSGAPTIDYLELNKKFSSLFPEFKLSDILHRFSSSRPLSEHISKFSSQYHSQFLSIVGWLLQHDLIVQLFTYVHLMVPTIPSSRYHSPSPNTTLLYQPQPFPLLPSHLSHHENAFFENIDDGTKSYQLFKRLSPYFRGRHHLEEIMWRENISREDLNKILKKYKNVLIQVTHEGDDKLVD